jgi:DNA-directed RNA polymerase specialized sigma subunit
MSNYSDLLPYVNKLPKKDICLIEMYYQSNKSQKQIANFFEVTSSAISHRLAVTCKKIALLKLMDKK